MGPSQTETTMKKKKKKKISFSLGGLASSSHDFNNIDQLDHIQTLLPISPVELAVALLRDSGVCLTNYASSKLVYGYDSENDDDAYLYHGAFALGGDTEEDFARHHWMIDSGCTDHLSPFLDDFAHLGNLVQHAVFANGQKVPMYGPGKIIINQRIKGSEPLVLKEVWYAPHAGHRLLLVPTLTSKGYKCIISDQESSIWDTNENLVIRACASSPNNNLHWFPSESMTPIRGLNNSLVKEDSYEPWHQRFGHISKNALHQAPFHVTGLPTVNTPVTTSPCKGCALGKMHDHSYPASGKCATHPLGLVHTDLWADAHRIMESCMLCPHFH